MPLCVCQECGREIDMGTTLCLSCGLMTARDVTTYIFDWLAVWASYGLLFLFMALVASQFISLALWKV
jgi:hypothetical protein